MPWNDSQDIFAYLIHRETLYFAKRPRSEDLHSPVSAVTSLIQGIYEHHPDQAHFIIRNRIYTNQTQATALSYGMVKVAAKRIIYGTTLSHSLPSRVVDYSGWRNLSQLSHPIQSPRKPSFDDTPFRGHDLQTILQKPELNDALFFSSFKKEFMSQSTDQQWMRLTHALLDSWSHKHTSSLQISSSQDSPPNLRSLDTSCTDLHTCDTHPHSDQSHSMTEAYAQDRSIAALLVGPHPIDDREIILGMSLNTQSVNRTLHAEVNLIQNYFQRTKTALPAHCKIFTTLKPCRMCAGMIWESASSPGSLKVFYSKDDPGAHATQTVLASHSEDRKRFLKNGVSASSEILVFLNLFSHK